MTIAIVTSRNFLLCESIKHISVRPDHDLIGNKHYNYYSIDIHFVPANQPSSQSQNNTNYGKATSSENTNFVSIRLIGEKPALKLFKELVTQIREQCPDTPYLDKMVENILSGATEDVLDDTSTVKVRKSRKSGKKTRRKV